jgi:enamine deaminase RidA (YjgF/YER057c/UK114 family)
MIERRIIEAMDAPPAAGGYAQAVEVAGASRLLFVSGQIPVDREDRVPPAFADQCRLAWANVDAQLRAAGMTLDDLAKVTIFLADRAYRIEARDIRQQVLGDRKLAMTVIIADIFDEAWLLEIEGIAAA